MCSESGPWRGLSRLCIHLLLLSVVQSQLLSGPHLELKDIFVGTTGNEDKLMTPDLIRSNGERCPCVCVLAVLGVCMHEHEHVCMCTASMTNGEAR